MDRTSPPGILFSLVQTPTLHSSNLRPLESCNRAMLETMEARLVYSSSRPYSNFFSRRLAHDPYVFKICSGRLADLPGHEGGVAWNQGFTPH
jgi:hypothetical protein